MSRRIAIILLALSACRSRRVDTAWHQETGYRWRELDVPGRGHAGFKPMASSHSSARAPSFGSRKC